MKGYRILALIIAIFITWPFSIKAKEPIHIPKYEIINEKVDAKFEREVKMTQMLNQTMGIFLLLSVSSVAMTAYDVHQSHE